MVFEAEIQEYENLRQTYQSQIIGRMDKEEYFKYNEILFSTHSKLLESTENAVINNVVHPMVLAARFHGYFEYLHPLETVMAERDDSSVIISFCGLVIHSSLFLPIVARNTFLH